ncbi:hypothetical protein [Granulibacter bethesdensis]|nr:hypothetical protein [Granulibacter bethesdensis]
MEDDFATPSSVGGFPTVNRVFRQMVEQLAPADQTIETLEHIIQ